MLAFLLGCAPTPAPTTTPPPAPECVLLEPGDRLVLAEGCADGLCGGTVYPDVVAALGAPDTCADGDRGVTCAWGDLSAGFPDCDHDGAPDEEVLCDLFDQTVTVGGAWDGASAEGLGLGVDASCFREVLGEPGASGWTFGFNPWIDVTVEPAAGPVGVIRLAWSWDE